jgi:hypothetical protein
MLIEKCNIYYRITKKSLLSQVELKNKFRLLNRVIDEWTYAQLDEEEKI